MHEKTNLQQKCSKKQEKQGSFFKKNSFFATSVQQNDIFCTRPEKKIDTRKSRTNVKKRYKTVKHVRDNE